MRSIIVLFNAQAIHKNTNIYIYIYIYIYMLIYIYIYLFEYISRYRDVRIFHKILYKISRMNFKQETWYTLGHGAGY